MSGARTVIEEIARAWVRQREPQPPAVEAFVAGARALCQELEGLKMPEVAVRRVEALTGPVCPGDIAYIGVRCEDGSRGVVKNHKDIEPLPLELRGGLRVNWGAASLNTEASEVLARSILADATGEAPPSAEIVRRFAKAVVAELPDRGFSITREEVLRWLFKAENHETDMRWRDGDYSSVELPF